MSLNSLKNFDSYNTEFKDSLDDTKISGDLTTSELEFCTDILHIITGGISFKMFSNKGLKYLILPYTNLLKISINRNTTPNLINRLYKIEKI